MNYSAVFNGLNVAIPQEGTANFVVKADIVDTVVSSPAVYTIGINDAANANSVRGVDAVGLTQYVKSTNAYDRPINFGSSATGKITVVANGANPIAQNVVTSTTTTTTGITALIFDLQNTSKYDVTLKTLSATLGYNNTTVSGYYLYDGSSIVASVGNPGSTTLSFGNLPSNFVVAANSTKTLTIKMDAAMNGTGAQSVSVASSQITAVDSSSNLITPTGSATGSDQTLQSTGVIVNLVSATATSVASTSGVSGYATGTFVFTVKANGVNLAKLSTVLPSANGTTTPGYIRALATAGGSVLTNVNYTVTPDTVVSDGSQVTVTLTTTKTTTAPGNVTFTIGSLEFENAAMTALLTPITTGLSTFHATVWAN